MQAFVVIHSNILKVLWVMQQADLHLFKPSSLWSQLKQLLVIFLEGHVWYYLLEMTVLIVQLMILPT